jgi:hypothetical protein
METTTIVGMFRNWDNAGDAIGVASEDRSAEAINLLNQANMVDVEALRREWERGGWTGFSRNA